MRKSNRKQVLRLTESDLHRIIKESVKRVIKEDTGVQYVVKSEITGEDIRPIFKINKFTSLDDAKEAFKMQYRELREKCPIDGDEGPRRYAGKGEKELYWSSSYLQCSVSLKEEDGDDYDEEDYDY